MRVKIVKAVGGWWHEKCIGDVIDVEERGVEFNQDAQAVNRPGDTMYTVYRVRSGEYKGYIIPRVDCGKPDDKTKSKRTKEKTGDELNKKSRKKRVLRKKKKKKL